MNYELKQYSFGQTIGITFSHFFNHLVQICLITLIVNIPTIILGIILFFQITNMVLLIITIVFAVIINSLLALYFNIAIPHILSKEILKERITGNDYLKNILPFVWPSIGCSLLVSLLVSLGSLLCYIPGFILLFCYYVSIPVLIIEKTKISKSLSRSLELTRKNRLTIFAYSFIIYLIIYAIMIPFMVVFIFIAYSMGPDMNNIENSKYFYLFFLIFIPVMIMIVPLLSCLQVVIYFNLRISKEGFNIEHLVDQFSLENTNEGTENIQNRGLETKQ
jgi:hypothetical protein